jgi:hypothetical protein
MHVLHLSISLVYRKKEHLIYTIVDTPLLGIKKAATQRSEWVTVGNGK